MDHVLSGATIAASGLRRTSRVERKPEQLDNAAHNEPSSASSTASSARTISLSSTSRDHHRVTPPDRPPGGDLLEQRAARALKTVPRWSQIALNYQPLLMVRQCF
jgi:hypothetical protein